MARTSTKAPTARAKTKAPKTPKAPKASGKATRGGFIAWVKHAINPVSAISQNTKTGKIGSGERAHPGVKEKLERDAKARGQTKLIVSKSNEGPNKSAKPPKAQKRLKPARGTAVRLGFELKYKTEVAKRHKEIKGRRLTRPIIQAINKLVEKDGEWGGGIDFEFDTHKPERMHRIGLRDREDRRADVVEPQVLVKQGWV